MEDDDARYRHPTRPVVPFASDRARVSVDRLAVEHLSADRVRQFLQAITVTRGCFPATCKSAPRRDSCFCPVRGPTQSRAHRVVGPHPRHPLPEMWTDTGDLSREAEDRRPAGCARPEHATKVVETKAVTPAWSTISQVRVQRQPPEVAVCGDARRTASAAFGPRGSRARVEAASEERGRRASGRPRRRVATGHPCRWVSRGGA